MTMNFSLSAPCTAFAGSQRIATGALQTVALVVRQFTQRDAQTPVLVFDDATGQQFDLDLRGTPAEVLERLALRATSTATTDTPAPAPEPARGPGRPKLGVVAREVTLLPRHWDWLNLQPGGASVALRKLVEEARRAGSSKDRVRQAQEASYRFMSAMAGDQPGFEEAARALFAAQATSFEALLQSWPTDVRAHALQLAVPVFEAEAERLVVP
ncbi:MAG TPA: DUF2239 family protein [Burkholderiaceae bacterium]|nr:DUF2239 family protein [Burkholderiaceae bacterium]